MSPPPSLSQEELASVRNLAQPLNRSDRDRFLHDLAEILASTPSRGPGVAYRTGVELQRRHFSATPRLNDPGPSPTA
jgi:hypothetical protein